MVCARVARSKPAYVGKVLLRWFASEPESAGRVIWRDGRSMPVAAGGELNAARRSRLSDGPGGGLRCRHGTRR
jgi:hypothetical protein